jgi:hypothetical protein
MDPFEGNLTTAEPVGGVIDHTHAALAELLVEDVAADGVYVTPLGSLAAWLHRGAWILVHAATSSALMAG